MPPSSPLHQPQLILVLLLLLTGESSNNGIPQPLQLREDVSNFRTLQPAKLLTVRKSTAAANEQLHQLLLHLFLRLERGLQAERQCGELEDVGRPSRTFRVF